MKEIEKLTAEQEAYLPIFRQSVIDRVTEKRDPELQKAAIENLYVFFGEKKPRHIVFLGPTRARILALALEALEKRGFNDLERALATINPETIESAIQSASTLGELKELDYQKDPENAPLYGNGWERAYSAWLQFGKYIGAELDEVKLKLFTEFADNIDGAYCYENLVIIIENPIEVHWKDQKLHNEKGAAIVYADGLKLYFIEGHKMPAKAILDAQSITLEDIKSEQNMEVKRILIRLFGATANDPSGYVKYLTEMNAKVIDVDLKGVSDYNAARSLLEDPETKDRYLLCTDGSTNRIYVLPTDKNAQTCKEAHEAICLFDESLIVAEG